VRPALYQWILAMSDDMPPVSRRRFLAGAAATAGAAAAKAVPRQALAKTIPADNSRARPGAGRRVLHIIGHSHIDAAWLWHWRDGEDEVFNTFRSALNRMRETPEFRYSHSSSAHYRWVLRADPKMWAEIKGRIEEGRWEVVGGWPVEPDCNIPSTESLVRDCLYGKKFIQETLGVDVAVGFNPDSFGHAFGIPTILKRAGYGYYVFQRPGDKENLLPHIFWWEGPDGSRVLTNRIWKSYDGDAEDIRKMVNGAFEDGLDHASFFLGVGDHGGAVTKEQVAKVLEMRFDASLPELRFSTLREFFGAVEQSPGISRLPIIKGELQHHARGCYSANGEVKYQNRRAERSLVQAEMISTVAAGTIAHEYPREEFAESWWKVLFCQFHDVLAGTSQYRDYEDVRDSLGFACEVAQTNKVEALEALARRVDTRNVIERAVFAFNSLPWARKSLLEFVIDDDHAIESKESKITHLRTQSGTVTPIQWRPAENMSQFVPRLSAWVELPAGGYQVFELVRGEAPGTTFSAGFGTPSADGFGLGSLTAADGTELLAAPLGLVVLTDTSDTWGHGMTEFRQEIGRPQLYSSSVVESGPVTCVTRHRARWQDSDIVMDIAQFAGLNFVELRFVIDWHEHEQILKLEIPTALTRPAIYAKVPGAVMTRSVNGEEEPYQDWVAVSGKRDSGTYTVALLNNSAYSYDCLGGLLRTVLIRSAPFARHNPSQIPHNDINAWQDQGRQERRFWLTGQAGSFAALNLDRMAQELQTPAEYIVDSAHDGTLPWQYALFEISPPSVEVLAIKKAERGNSSFVIRLQERSGQAARVSIKSAPLGLDHHVRINPWEIKTWLVTTNPSSASELREVSELEM
jgi:alpha-mannosidase